MATLIDGGGLTAGALVPGALCCPFETALKSWLAAMPPIPWFSQLLLFLSQFESSEFVTRCRASASTSIDKIDGDLNNKSSLVAIRLTIAFSCVSIALSSNGWLGDLMWSKGGQPTLHFFFRLGGADPVAVRLVTVLLQVSHSYSHSPF